MRRLFRPLAVLLAALALGATPAAQELDCTVNVNFSQLAGNEFGFLADLRDDIEQYVNGRSWTEDRFEEYERIRCSMSIVFVEAQGLDRFTANIIVASQRPIYGTARRIPVVTINDSQWQFQYNRGQPLIFDTNRYNALTSVLDYYAFLILGYDYDTFSELGGTPYFEEAREISELAQAQGDPGWLSIGDDRTRTALVRQLLDARYLPLRRAYFLYHFGALDSFTRNPDLAWETGYSAIEAVYELFLEVSRKYSTDLFFAAKADQIVELFADADDVRSELYALLVEMDPARSSEYDQLLQ